MSIEDLREKSNPGTLISFGEEKGVEKAPNLRDKIKPLYTLILLLVVASIFFALGRLSSLEEKKSPIRVTYPNASQTSAAGLAIPSTTTGIGTTKENTPVVQSEAGGEVIGVKTSKKFYLPWCGVLKRAKPENQVHFASPDLARAAGYVAGGGCKGLK